MPNLAIQYSYFCYWMFISPFATLYFLFYLSINISSLLHSQSHGVDQIHNSYYLVQFCHCSFQYIISCTLFHLYVEELGKCHYLSTCHFLVSNLKDDVNSNNDRTAAGEHQPFKAECINVLKSLVRLYPHLQISDQTAVRKMFHLCKWSSLSLISYSLVLNVKQSYLFRLVLC